MREIAEALVLSPIEWSLSVADGGGGRVSVVMFSECSEYQ